VPESPVSASSVSGNSAAGISDSTWDDGRACDPELARKINRGPWVPPAEVSFPEQRRSQVGPEELAKRQREVWRVSSGKGNGQ
jgi:hypothetical protein